MRGTPTRALREETLVPAVYDRYYQSLYTIFWSLTCLYFSRCQHFQLGGYCGLIDPGRIELFVLRSIIAISVKPGDKLRFPQ